MATKLRLSWMPALVAVLALYYLALGVVVGGGIGLVGIAGAVLISTALVMRPQSRWIAAILLATGAIPFAVLLWWSVIAPVLGLVTLIIGGALIVRRSNDIERGLERNLRSTGV